MGTKAVARKSKKSAAPVKVASSKNVNEDAAVLQGIVEIPLDRIVADSQFNARKVYDGQDGGQTIEELAESIKRDGQLQPVLVRSNGPGKYSLVYGFRRFKAMEHLAKEGKKPLGGSPGHIKAQQWEGTERDAVLINLAENSARNDLVSWEVADRAKMIRDEYGMSGPAIANRMGRSTSYVNNLLRVVDNVHPEILEAWRKRDGRCTTDQMNKWSKLGTVKQEQQLEEFHALASEPGESEGSGESGESKPKDKPRPSKQKLLDALKAAARAKNIDADYKKGLRDALRFATGKAPTIPGVFDPDDKPSKKSDEDE